MEPVPAGPARGRARHAPHQPRVRAARRDHGPRPLGLGDLQLLGARYRQHGAAAPVRHARAARTLAGAAAERRDPLLLRHDRAGRRELRRDQHRHPDRARRGALRDQRPQVVHHQRRRPALQDLHRHGRDRSGRRGASPPLHGAGADGHARRHGRAQPADHAPRRARGHARCALRTCACRSPTCWARRGKGFALAQARLGPRAHPPLHALDRPVRAGARADVRARPRAHGRSARSCTSTARSPSGSRSRAWRSTRRGCWCCAPPG